MAGQGLLEANNLFCSYGLRAVLKGVNLRVRAGEAVAVVGRSGSGKTTLAYCLTGIIPYKVQAEVKGEVRVNGRSYAGLGFRDIVKRVNIVLEEYEAQIFGLTVEEELAFGLENLGLAEEEVRGRVEWALKKFGLAGRRGMLVSELSGGLKQRLVIASTAVLRPDFLVLDNPTANLDWSGILRLREIVNELKKCGCGLVLMLRKLKGLEDCVDRVYLLDGGVLKEVKPGSNAWYFPLGVRGFKGDDVHREKKAVIEVENVWFRYNGPYVLRDVNLKVYEGEILAVMGSNGSGKTTLMKHLNGLLKPCKGRVLVCGRDTRECSASSLARLVGLAFQDPDKHLFADTVWEEVSFGCKVLGLPVENAVNALKMLRLYGLRDRGIHELSMGEKVRVVIASALALNPRVLVLDEPTTGQDPELLAELAGLLLRLKRAGKSVVVVTHDSDFALEVADRVAVLVDGRVRWCGSPGEVLLNGEVLREACLEPPSRLEGWCYVS